MSGVNVAGDSAAHPPGLHAAPHYGHGKSCLDQYFDFIFYLLLTAFDYFGHSQGRVGFMIWIWAIYFTFPGTYSTQPAVTTQVNRVFLKVSRNIFNLPSPVSFEGISTSIFIFTWNLGITLKRSKTFNLFA